MTNDPGNPKTGPYAAIPAQDMPRRRKRLGLRILLGIAVLVLAGLAVTAAVYRDTLALLLHPERIEISTLPETETALRVLEYDGDIRGLQMSADRDRTAMSFRSADGSVEIRVEYIGDSFRFMEGQINAMQSSVQTIPQAEDFAGTLLSPFFDMDEVRAIILKFSPDIVAQAGRDEMDMSLALGERYAATIKGHPMETVRFSVEWIAE